MINYSQEVEKMCCVAKGPKHGPAPIPEEGKWVKAYDIKDISGFSHGVGWCAPQQGACKLSLNVKDGVVVEALVETMFATQSTLLCVSFSFSSYTAEASPLSRRTVLPSAPVLRISARVFALR